MSKFSNSVDFVEIVATSLYSNNSGYTALAISSSTMTNAVPNRKIQERLQSTIGLAFLKLLVGFGNIYIYIYSVDSAA